MTKIIILVITALVLTIGISLFIMNISYDNKEIELRTEGEAQEKKCEAYFDKMWKILKQKAGVTDQYKNAFKDIYTGLIAGRYSQGDGTLMKWIRESNPSFDASLYKDLMNSIESQREGFFNEQSRLIDIKAQHEMLIKKAPSNWFIDSGIKPLEIKIITSESTKNTYETGEENEVDLFGKKDLKK